MRKFLEFWQFYKLYCRVEVLVKEQLTKEDRDNLGALYINPLYKSLTKLENSIIIDLENKMFKEAQQHEEFLAIKWSRLMLKLIQQQVQRHYDDVIKQAVSKKIAHEEKIEEKFENLPDGVPLNPTPHGSSPSPSRENVHNASGSAG